MFGKIHLRLDHLPDRLFAAVEITFDRLDRFGRDFEVVAGKEAVAVELDLVVDVFRSSRLPINNHQSTVGRLIGKVDLDVDLGTFKIEGLHRLDQFPILHRDRLHPFRKNNIREGRQALSRGVVPLGPLFVGDIDFVFVFVKSEDFSRPLAIFFVPRLPEFPSHPLGELGQKGVDGKLPGRLIMLEGHLDRMVHDLPHPHLAALEVLQGVEFPRFGIRPGIPPAPGAVVVVIILSRTLAEFLIPRF